MLSRVGDSLYWMSRYLERAEHTARVLEVHLSMLLEGPDGDMDFRWRSLVQSLGLVAPTGMTNLVLASWLSTDTANRSSIVSCIMAARDNARQVREQISSEMWEQLNRLFHRVRYPDRNQDWSSDQQDFLRDVREGAHLFQGITDSTMNHGEGWQFIQLGRFIERAVAVSKIIGVHFRDSAASRAHSSFDEDPEAITLLKACTAFEAYCKVYTAELRPLRIAEFLLLNPEFPHSVRFAIDQVETALRKLPQSSDRKSGGRPSRLAGKLQALLSFSQMDEIMANGLHLFLEDIERQCSQIHNAMNHVYVEYPIEAALEA